MPTTYTKQTANTTAYTRPNSSDRPKMTGLYDSGVFDTARFDIAQPYGEIYKKVARSAATSWTRPAQS